MIVAKADKDKKQLFFLLVRWLSLTSSTDLVVYSAG